MDRLPMCNALRLPLIVEAAIWKYTLRPRGTVAANVLDGKSRVEAECEQPAADEHRRRIPGAMGELVTRNSAGHADHEARQHDVGDVMSPMGRASGGAS